MKNGVICLCGSRDLKLLQEFTTPPSGETSFAFVGKYKRSLWQCVRCRHIVQHHDMDLANLYSGAYVEATYGVGIRKRFEKIICLPPEHSDNEGRVARVSALFEFFFKETPSAAVNILDVGSGLGVFPYRLRQSGWECVALDPDEKAIVHMQERGIPAVKADFFTVRLEDPPVERSGRPFQAVTFNKVLEHVPDPVSMLARARSFIEDAGCVYIELPDGEWALSEGLDREEFFLEHYHAFSLASAAITVTKAGFLPLRAERLREPSGKYTLWVFARKNI